MRADEKRGRALQMLVLCTLCWAVSFPTMKALGQAQQALAPGGDSWFFSALCVVYRFGAAGVIMTLLSLPTLKSLTRKELEHGLGLGVFGGAGILLQMDGLAHTSASTSAFLTQCYAVFIPCYVASRQRRWPAVRVLLACLLVMAGVAVLSGLHWSDLRLGRGEFETIAAAVFFTGQILWLERPAYADNRVNHFSAVMFLAMAAVCLPLAMLTTPHASAWRTAYGTAPTLFCLAVLVGVSTLGGYMLMNHFQRHLTATEAGLIYCTEPVFASLLALVLPGFFSAWAGIAYPNERIGPELLLGGGLITAANMLLQWSGRREARSASSLATD